MATQFFINCAHINVIGGGGGDLDNYPYAKFPGAYDYMDPGTFIYWMIDERIISRNRASNRADICTGIWSNRDIPSRKNLLKYVPPGPPVWQG